MRIAILTHNYPKNSQDRQDAGVFVYDFAQELAKKHQVFIYCPNFLGEKENYTAVPVTWFNWLGGQSKLGSLNPKKPLDAIKILDLIVSGCRQVSSFIKKNNIDYCLAAWSFPSGVYALYAKKILNTPYAAWSLGSDINQYANLPLLKDLIKFALRSASTRFANSRSLSDKIRQLTGKDCEFMPAITDFEDLKVKPIKLEANKFHFLFVGRLEKVKGVDRFISALCQLSLPKHQFAFHLLGDGSQRSLLETQVKSCGLSNTVHFHGNQGKQEVASYMKRSDCLVVSSRSESLPLVIIEAAKSGLPVLTTSVGDCSYLVNKYKIGRTLHGDDPEDWVHIIRQVMSDSNFRSRFQIGLRNLANDFIQTKAVDIFQKGLK